MSMDRRTLMSRVLMLMGASAAASVSQTAAALAQMAEGEGGVLSAEQMAVLTAASERIIPATDTPGAAEAGVPAWLDRLLASWATPETRAEITGAIDAIAGLPGDGRSFAALSSAEQHDLLAAHDSAALTAVGEPEGSGFGRRVPLADPAYAKLKQLIVGLYYMTEAAMTEELIYRQTPGRWDPSIPVTPDTRPWGAAMLI